jgi:hypothetical protein
VNGFWAFVTRLAGRPSTVWRLAWLTFCLLVVCLAGARTLRKIVPYVLAGVADRPTGTALPKQTTTDTDDLGTFATWVLPALSWMLLTAAATLVLIYRLHRAAGP